MDARAHWSIWIIPPPCDGLLAYPVSTINQAHADAIADALAEALPAGEDVIDALMRVMASASLNALRIARPGFVVQAARRHAPDDEPKAVIDDLYWATLEIIEGEDGPQPEDYTPPPDPEPVVATAEDLAVKDALLDRAQGEAINAATIPSLLLAEVASRFTHGCNRRPRWRLYLGRATRPGLREAGHPHR